MNLLLFKLPIATTISLSPPTLRRPPPSTPWIWIGRLWDVGFCRSYPAHALPFAQHRCHGRRGRAIAGGQWSRPAHTLNRQIWFLLIVVIARCRCLRAAGALSAFAFGSAPTSVTSISPRRAPLRDHATAPVVVMSPARPRARSRFYDIPIQYPS